MSKKKEEISISNARKKIINEEVESFRYLCDCLKLKIPKDEIEAKEFRNIITHIIIIKKEEGKFLIKDIKENYDIILTPEEYWDKEKIIRRYHPIFNESKGNITMKLESNLLYRGDCDFLALSHANIEVDEIF